MHSRTFPLLASFCLLLLAVPANSEDVAADWTVSADTTLDGATKSVTGDVLVKPGAKLHLLGSTLLVGGTLRVEPGAQLLLSPSAGRATMLGPVGDSFRVEVDGHVSSAGLPASQVRGIHGEGTGWSTAVGRAPGGFRVNGTGDLQDFELRDSRVGFIVGPSGSLRLRDALIDGTGAFGAVSYGDLAVQRLTARNVGIALFGRGLDMPCRLAVSDSTLAADGGNIQMNGCDLEAVRNVLMGGSTSMFLNGRAESLLADTRVSGYGHHGLHVEGHTVLTLRNVTFDGAGEGRDGLDVGARATVLLEDAAIEGHQTNGITAQLATVHLGEGTRLAGNGAHGIQAVRSQVVGWENVIFGPVPNKSAPVAVVALREVQVRGGDGALASGVRLEVLAIDGTLVHNGTTDGARPIQAAFNTYGTTGDGSPRDLGPFTYRLLVDGKLVAEGEFATDPAPLEVTLPAGASGAPGPAVAWLLLVLGVMAARSRSRPADSSC